jgi:ArsR family transcriptional regulator
MTILKLLKAVSDENRIRILNIIKEDALCVGEIQMILGIKQSNTSRHLEKLRSSNLIKSFKDAQRVFYILNKELLDNYDFLESLLFIDSAKNETLNNDIRNLLNYKMNNTTCINKKGEKQL